MTNRSTNVCTGVAARRSPSSARSRITRACFAGKRRARLVLNLSTSNGMPWWRRRRWPMGYSMTTSSSLLPSSNSTVIALAMDGHRTDVGGLGVQCRVVRNLEDNVLHDVAAVRPQESEHLFLQQLVVEAPAVIDQHRCLPHCDVRRHERQANAAGSRVARR